MILSDEDIEFIKFASDTVNKGYYPSSHAITDCYNRCYADRFKRPQGYTSCGMCIRNMVFELKRDLDIEMAKIEKEINNEINNSPE